MDQGVNASTILSVKAGQPLAVAITTWVIRMAALIDDRAFMPEMCEISSHKSSVRFMRRDQMYIAAKIPERPRWSIGGIVSAAAVRVPAIHDLLTANKCRDLSSIRVAADCRVRLLCHYEEDNDPAVNTRSHNSVH
jgi:hypothetical protein